jgi:hypothetical protein
VVTGISYVLATGAQWKAMPWECGWGSAIHGYFQAWVEWGVFEQFWQLAFIEYDELKGIDWKWQSLDGAKAPMCLTRSWLPRPWTPLRSSAPAYRMGQERLV